MTRVLLLLTLIASVVLNLDGSTSSIAAGESGTAVVPLGAGSGFDTLSFIDNAQGCAGGLDTITCTYDAGKTWRTTLLPRPAVTQLQLVDPTHGWAVIDGGLWETYSTGRYWSWHPEKYAFSAVDFISRQIGWAVTPHGDLIITRNGGIIFTRVTTPVLAQAIDFLDAATGWIFGRNGETLFTSDGGKTWTTRSTLPLAASWPDGWRAQLEMVTPASGWLLLAMGQGCGFQMPYVVYHTDDGARHWNVRMVGAGVCGGKYYPSSPFVVGNYPGNLVALDADHAVLSVTNLAASRFYAVRTSDAGLHWTQVNPLRRAVNAPTLAMAFVSPEVGWAVTPGEGAPNATGHILHTTDGGLSWHTQRTLRH